MVEGRVYTRDTLERGAAALGRAGTVPELPVRSSILSSYCARRRVMRWVGARPSRDPLPGRPVSRRPLQEDQSRCAENQPCARDC